MSRPRTPRVKYAQASIEDFNLGTEHIAGAVSADLDEAEARQQEFYAQFVAKVEELGPILCMPAYGVHVYHLGRRACVCKERSRTLAQVESQFRELP